MSLDLEKLVKMQSLFLLMEFYVLIYAQEGPKQVQIMTKIVLILSRGVPLRR